MTDAQKFQFLFWAYNIIWLLIAGYLLMLGVRQRRLQRLIERLRESMGKDRGSKCVDKPRPS